MTERDAAGPGTAAGADGEAAGTDGAAGADVSVVIPCFRSGATLERAVSSVLAQTRLPREVILVDDASGDGTLTQLHELGRRHPGVVEVVELTRNGGAGTARNAGWDRATATFVAFLDADDSWHPRKLELQAAYMQERPELALTGTASRIVPHGATGAGAADTIPAAIGAAPVTAAALRRSNAFLTSSTMVRRALTVRFPDRRASEDYELWLRIVLGGRPAAVLDAELAFRHKEHFGAGGLSGQLWRMELGELRALRRIRRLGLLGWAGFVESAGWSMAKFGRRLAVAGARRLTAAGTRRLTASGPRPGAG